MVIDCFCPSRLLDSAQSNEGLDSDLLAMSLAVQVAIARASDLARRGEYQNARGLLTALPNEQQRSPAVLDLLARMAAQQGKFSEAKRHWEEVLQQTPNEPSALAALSRIETRENRRFRPALVWLVSVGLLAIVAVVGSRLLSSSSDTPNQELLTEAEQQSNAASTLAQNVASPEPASPGGEPSRAPNIQIDLAGIEMDQAGNATSIRFLNGLFDEGTNLTESAAVVLRDLGDRLEDYARDVDVTVVGYTDDIPTRPGGGWMDNHQLGLRRAIAVVEYLRSTSGLPASLFSARTDGPIGPPYPNDSFANRMRNRTVVLLLTSRRSES